MSVIEVSSLCNHAFINDLRDKICAESTKCMDVIAYGQDILYIWNSFDACVHAVNIKQSIRDSDLNTQLVLHPIQGISFSPEKLLLNFSSTLLALTANTDGNSGIAILDLPERWSTIHKSLKVKCTNIGERLFFGEQQTLRQAKWHPGSPSDSHLVVLTSDECLRLYDVSNGEVLWKCILSHKSKLSTHTTIPSKISLGDTPIDFDVGPPPVVDDASKIKWPIMVLWGNGDIYCVETAIEDDRERIPAQGPLRMFPSSDDNYGSDASSILVLHTLPPIVAFSTCVGTIYNCIYLNNDSSSDSEKSLCVIECIELEVGISLGDDDELVSCPIHLMKNPVEKSMYFSVHKAGIHSITLPLVTKLYEFLESPEVDFSPYTSESLVEYLLCTGVNKGSSLTALPLLGCAFVDLSSSLLVLLNNQDLINIKITPHILHSMQNLETSIDQNHEDDGFLLHIQNILKEHGPGPVMKLPDSNPKDIYNVIYKMKLQYKATMEAHEKVANKLESKSTTLMAALLQQQKDVLSLGEEKEKLFAEAILIAQRYQEINEKQMSLMCRMENIMRNVCLDSRLTEKERQALTYLDDIHRKISVYEDEIRRIRVGCKHQESVLEERVVNMTKKGIDLGNVRGKLIRKQLHNLTTKMSEVMRKIKDIEEAIPEIMLQSSLSFVRLN